MAKRKEARKPVIAAPPATAESSPTPAEESSLTQAEPASPPETAASEAAPPLEAPAAPAESNSAASDPAASDLPASALAASDLAASDLPLVDSPRMDACEPSIGETAQAAAEAAAPDITDTATAAAPSRGISRFALLAASIALAAAVGSFAGSLGAAGVARLFPGAPAPAVAVASRSNPQFAAEISALKANIDAASRNASAQIAKIADRIDRAEKAQADPTAKITRIAEAVDRLDKRSTERAQSDSAAKIAHIAEAVDRLEKRSASAAAATAAPEITGSITPAQPTPAGQDAKPNDHVLDGWVVHQVANGHALVESRYGNLFDIAAGGFLPGVGRVEQIKRQDGRWLIVTARGVIESYH